MFCAGNHRVRSRLDARLIDNIRDDTTMSARACPADGWRFFKDRLS
jgi:hypothetical protein